MKMETHTHTQRDREKVSVDAIHASAVHTVKILFLHIQHFIEVYPQIVFLGVCVLARCFDVYGSEYVY